MLFYTSIMLLYSILIRIFLIQLLIELYYIKFIVFRAKYLHKYIYRKEPTSNLRDLYKFAFNGVQDIFSKKHAFIISINIRFSFSWWESSRRFCKEKFCVPRELHNSFVNIIYLYKMKCIHLNNAISLFWGNDLKS